MKCAKVSPNPNLTVLQHKHLQTINKVIVLLFDICVYFVVVLLIF